MCVQWHEPQRVRPEPWPVTELLSSSVRRARVWSLFFFTVLGVLVVTFPTFGERAALHVVAALMSFVAAVWFAAKALPE